MKTKNIFSKMSGVLFVLVMVLLICGTGCTSKTKELSQEQVIVLPEGVEVSTYWDENVLVVETWEAVVEYKVNRNVVECVSIIEGGLSMSNNETVDGWEVIEVHQGSFGKSVLGLMCKR